MSNGPYQYIIKVCDRENQDARDYTIMRRSQKEGEGVTEALDPKKGWIEIPGFAVIQPSFTLYGPSMLDTIKIMRLVWSEVDTL